MTVTRGAVLTEDEIKAAAKKYAVEWLPSNTVGGTFEAGARFARDFYEHREALWREYVELLTKENGALAGIAIAHGWAGSEENYEDGKRLRAALGLEG